MSDLADDQSGCQLPLATIRANWVQDLKSAGIVPDSVDVLRAWDRDLMPELASMWIDNSTVDSTAGRWIQALAGSGELRIVDRDGDFAPLHAVIGDRLVYLRGFDFEKRTLGIASSRIGRDLAGKSAWFRFLRAACVRAAQNDEFVLTSKGTSTEQFVRRCKELFGTRVCVVVVSESQSLRDWFRDEIVAASSIEPASRNETAAILISPAVAVNDQAVESPVTAPEADRALAALSDRLLALATRKGGNWDRLIRWRLDSNHHGVGTTLIALGERSITNKVRDELLAAGAIGWTVTSVLQQSAVDSSTESDSSTGASGKNSTGKAERAARYGPTVSSIDFTEYLAHCTRRRDGPWPNQSKQAYLDDLILESADHSALSTLVRIAEMRCLLGSSDSIAGDTPIVSFTAVPLDELQQLRVFRSHRGRWDFEPYGICIRRSWIQNQNGKPVRYATRDEWETMSHEQRLFWHLDTTTTKSGNEIDWTVEQEWRVPGDLDLTELTADDAFVFVPTSKEARVLATCPWPVVALSDVVD